MAGHQVTVRPSGREFSVNAGETVLDAALHAGITLPHGCKNGACGSCKGKVLTGTVHHREHTSSALTAEEESAGMALFCCAVPETDLVIEARIVAALDGVVPRKMPARVEHIERAAHDVVVLQLRLPATESLIYRAGQYVDFILPNGVRRSYSIASMPGGDGPI